MMKRPFRQHHILEILNAFEQRALPLDLFLKNYFKLHKAVGSKDRKEICETIYSMIRWRGLLDYFSKKSPTWESRYATFLELRPLDHINDLSIPAHVRVSFPKIFFQMLEESLGTDKALQFCLESNGEAPTTVRANALKISRDELFARWEAVQPIKACLHSQVGISFTKRINFFELPEFKSGYFEVQDEASQLIAALVAAGPGDHFLDYCAGSGGKALAVAPGMKGSGQLYLHDIRPQALVEAKKRLKRAGIQNAQTVLPGTPQLRALKGRMDWVLVDAPCSGTGTLRRNPDMKWKFDSDMVQRLVEEQRTIFKEAFTFLKPTGRIIYATCSVLPQENSQQADYFLQNFPLKLCCEPFQSFPLKGGMDGFFGAVFEMAQKNPKID